MAHSFVDYPARTAAIACVFALCCGLADTTTQVIEPRRSGRGRERRSGMIVLSVGMDPRRRDRACAREDERPAPP